MAAIAKLLALVCLLLFARCQVQSDFVVFPSHSLEFPLIVEDMQNWETRGSAVMGKTQMHLNPEVKQRQGLVYNNMPIMEKEWIMDIEFVIGNTGMHKYTNSDITLIFPHQPDNE